MGANEYGWRWLSEGAETLVQEIEAASDAKFHCEVLIVGSGYGGAVGAARLAGAASKSSAIVSVFVLERGQEYLPGMFPATFAELPGHVRFSMQDGTAPRGKPEGLFDMRIGGDVNVLLGSGLGGGSLINAAVMERPDPEVFNDPRWPIGTDAASLDASYKRAEAMLVPQQLPESVAKFESLDKTAVAMGANGAQKAKLAIAFAEGKQGSPVKPTPAGVAMKDCLRCGDCVTGCNHRAKKSLDVNYLALARANDARLFCGATVHRLLALEDDGYAVEFFLTDPTKARSDRRPYVLRARRVILAAGSLGSTEILLRSRAAGLPIAEGEALGSNFSANGDLIAVAYRQNEPAPCCGKEGDPPASRKIGPTITGLFRHTVQDEEKRTYRVVFEEFAIPAPLRRLLGEVVATTSAVHGLVKIDRSLHLNNERFDDPLAVSDEALDHSMVYGMMGDDGAAGTIELPPREASDPHAPRDGRVHVTWEQAGEAPVLAAQVAALRDAHEGLGKRGGQVLPNPSWHPLPPFGESTLHGPPLSVHPLGGCPMADDKAKGVVDAFGRVFAAAGDAKAVLRGLAVLDGSIVPAALGINPSLTITALAERAIGTLATDWCLVLRGLDLPQDVPRPVRRCVEQPRAPLDTTIKLQERMTGRLVIGGRTFDAGAVAEFEPIESRKLRRFPRLIKQPKVTLTFTGTEANSKTTQVSCEGAATLLTRERSSLLVRVLRVIGLAKRRLRAYLGALGGEPIEFIALCSHIGQVRLIRYNWTVTGAGEGAPLKEGARLRLTKRIEFTETGNPWRQLSEGRLELMDDGPIDLGRLALDPSFFVEQLAPLLGIESQQDEPNAAGDVIELALWIVRIVLRIHFLNFLPPPDKTTRAKDRMPGTVDGVVPQKFEENVPAANVPIGETPKVRLSRYMPSQRKTGARPVMLIHGYGAGGSTFAHESIGGNLVQALMKAGREAWVLDLRTSIGMEQRSYWSFDDVANCDIPFAIDRILKIEAGDGKVDIVAHCIGAAMFSVAVLASTDLHKKIGVVVLSQVGPMVRMSAFNRFRGFVASYLQEFIGVRELDVELESGSLKTMLVDGLLGMFPYPDDDCEAERSRSVPGFAAVRHRADAIFGQTMQLENIGDPLLLKLNSIYGWVMVKGLAQTIHYAREKLLTDPNGLNQVVAFETVSTRMAFPLLLVHGRKNAMFDWRGSYETIKLLTDIFDMAALPKDPPPINPVGAGSRWLHVFDAYGHQDTLVGAQAHRDVFPVIVDFLNKFAKTEPTEAKSNPPLAVEFPAIGPTLGRVIQRGKELICRMALRPPQARASAVAIAFVPAQRIDSGWQFDFANTAIVKVNRDKLIKEAIEIRLAIDRLPDYQGFAVLTVHRDLPAFTILRIFGDLPQRPLFTQPKNGPTEEIRTKLRERLYPGNGAAVDLAVVHLDPAWIAAAEQGSKQAPQRALSLAIASCQYPPGLVDRTPAQHSLARMAERLAASSQHERPQLLLLTGDQVYIDATAGLFDPGGADDIGRAYQLNLTLPAFRRVTKALPTFPLLDDHEVEDNWEPERPLSKTHADSLQAYSQYWHKLVEDSAPKLKFDYSITPAGFPIFLLDVRTQRERRVLRATATAKLLDEAHIHTQDAFDKLLQWLAVAPRDIPKFVVSSTAVFPFPRAALGGSLGERIGLDDWSGYPRSQFELLDFIRANEIPNVVLLSGDRHMSSVSSLWIDNGKEQEPLEVVSVVSSGLYAPWPFANTRADDLWLEGAVVLERGVNKINANVITAATGSSDGFAFVRVIRRDTKWDIRVLLDLADGAITCERTLGDAENMKWTVSR